MQLKSDTTVLSLRFLFSLIVAFSTGHAMADALALRLDKTATPGQVRAHWIGGVPTFTVYESPSPSGLSSPANELGTTSVTEWFDTPAGAISYYLVTSPCTADPPAVCCANDAECLGTEFCAPATSTCALKQTNGASCGDPNQCQSANCVDTVCCNSPCGGTCRGCDSTGLEGSCSLFHVATDPDSECNGVSCVGSYWGFFGNSCYRKADVSAAQATCDGAGSCRSVTQECAASGQGPAVLTCNALCQSPTSGTCTGTTAGTCTNVNPGTQSCGLGPCRNTVQQCINGAPVTCNPLPNSTTETCNGVDDNCDGVLDNNPTFADTLEPNDDCATYRTLTSASNTGPTITLNTAGVYPFGDIDIYRLPAIEQGGTCACCDTFCTMEDFRLTATLFVPSGAGSYEICLWKDTCGTWSNCTVVAAGSSGSVSSPYAGTCFGQDDSSHFVRIRGFGGQGFKCNPYTLQYRFEQGCFL